MAEGMYLGRSSVAREIEDGDIGIAGVARRLKYGYLGVSGVARRFYVGSIYIDTLSIERVFDYDYDNEENHGIGLVDRVGSEDSALRVYKSTSYTFDPLSGRYTLNDPITTVSNRGTVDQYFIVGSTSSSTIRCLVSGGAGTFWNTSTAYSSAYIRWARGSTVQTRKGVLTTLE